MGLNTVGDQLDPENLPSGVSMPSLGKYGPDIEDVRNEDNDDEVLTSDSDGGKVAYVKEV